MTSIIYLLVNLLAVVLGGLSMFFLLRKAHVEKWASAGITFLICLVAVIFGCSLELKLSERVAEVNFDSLRAVAGIGIMLIISYFAFRKYFEAILRAAILSSPLMYGLAKIGCAVAGCCHGIEYSGPFNMHGYFPIQPVETVIFLGIYLLGLKTKSVSAAVYVSLSAKLLLDFLRADRGGIISRNQILILIYLAVWSVVSICAHRKSICKSST